MDIDKDPNGDANCVCARCRAEESHDFDKEPHVKFDRSGKRIDYMDTCVAMETVLNMAKALYRRDGEFCRPATCPHDVTVAFNVVEDFIVKTRSNQLMNKVKYEFTDAQSMARMHPYTFMAPGLEELAVIKVGDFVKVCHNNERFWSIVKSVDGVTVTAEVNNDLICSQPFKCGDTISFEKRHIYDIIIDK